MLVVALAKEARTPQIAHWLESQSGQELAVSDWVIAAFSSALSIKRRTGQIDDSGRADALIEFKRLVDVSFSVLPVERAQFRMASQFAGQFALGLRAGDALHLAIAADHRATLCTLDRRLEQYGLKLNRIMRMRASHDAIQLSHEIARQNKVRAW